jgi:membrane-associated phospholipid phosphatase
MTRHSGRNITPRYLCIMVAGYALWVALYEATALIGAWRGMAVNPALPADAAIPFLPWMMPVYLLCYVVVPLLFVIDRSPAFLNRAFLTLIAANLGAFLIFALVPAQGPPRSAAPVSGLLQPIFMLLYAADTRWNALPSLHVTNPWLVALLAAQARGATVRTAVLFLLALAISLATLTIRQHYILDVLAGMALAFGTFAMMRRVRVGDGVWFQCRDDTLR